MLRRQKKVSKSGAEAEKYYTKQSSTIIDNYVDNGFDNLSTGTRRNCTEIKNKQKDVIILNIRTILLQKSKMQQIVNELENYEVITLQEIRWEVKEKRIENPDFVLQYSSQRDENIKAYLFKSGNWKDKY